MKVVVFGLTVSSSWGNGHATLWRGLIGALSARHHEVVFFEKDVPYYASHRDVHQLPSGRLELYASWPEVEPTARRELSNADACIVTSFCPDAIVASRLSFESGVDVTAFYELDAPVTLAAIRRGERPPYIEDRGLVDFDVVLSFTGGPALDALRCELGARRVVPLFGYADPNAHRPVPRSEGYDGTLSYLGTYSNDRRDGVEELFFAPARRLPTDTFVLGGAMYPGDTDWPANVRRFDHVAPSEHPAFFCSSRLTLNVTRGDMANMGHCPSGRLFEAAACGAPIVSDAWEGIADFFEPGEEILIARSREDVLGATTLTDAELGRVARAARERTLAQHTAAHRALELERCLFSRQRGLAGRQAAGV